MNRELRSIKHTNPTSVQDARNSINHHIVQITRYTHVQLLQHFYPFYKRTPIRTIIQEENLKSSVSPRTQWFYTSQKCLHHQHVIPPQHHNRIAESTYWLQAIPLIENASTSLGKSLESMILNPIELPCWFSCSLFRYPKAKPTGAPSIYALQADKISLDRRLKCSSTNASKCCIKEERNHSKLMKKMHLINL